MEGEQTLTCDACGSTRVSQSWKAERINIKTRKGKKSTSIEVPVKTCKDCEIETTEKEAEDIRAKAVKQLQVGAREMMRAGCPIRFNDSVNRVPLSDNGSIPDMNAVEEIYKELWPEAEHVLSCMIDYIRRLERDLTDSAIKESEETLDEEE